MSVFPYVVNEGITGEPNIIDAKFDCSVLKEPLTENVLIGYQTTL